MPLIITHAKCMDGYGVAWAAHRFLRAQDRDGTYRGPDVILAEHARRPEDYVIPDVAGRDVLVFDFAYPKAITEQLHAAAESFAVYDHHATRAAELADLPYCHFDMKHSGAVLAWRHFHGKIAEPHWIVQYVQDRDLWRFELPESRAVNTYLQSLRMTPYAWDDAAELGLAEAKRLGGYMTAPQEAYIREVRQLAVRGTFAGYDVPVVNAPHWGISELVGSLAYDAVFAVGWHQIADGTFKYSLRSRPDSDFDVGKLAERFGGGGHKHCGGFIAATLQHDVLPLPLGD